MRNLLYASFLSLLLSAGAGAQTPWIIGGASAAQGQFPWVGAIMYNGTHRCGAALIDPRWAITAAHCVLDQTSGQPLVLQGTRIRFNAVNLAGALPQGGLTVGVKALIPFPAFNRNQFGDGYDIALVELDTAITAIVPIPLPAIGDTAALYSTGNAVRIAGWGLQDTGGTSTPNIMKWCSTQVYDFVLCSSSYQALYGIPVSQDRFCAGYSGGQTPAGGAAGDSGGPIWQEQGTSRTLLGVVSGGFSYATRADQPGFYTRAALYRPWIDSVMGRTGPPQGIEVAAGLNESTVRVGNSGDAIRLDFGTVKATGVHLALIGADGRVVYQALLPQPSGLSYTINTGALPAGLYVLRIFDPRTGACFTQKLAHVGQ